MSWEEYQHSAIYLAHQKLSGLIADLNKGFITYNIIVQNRRNLKSSSHIGIYFIFKYSIFVSHLCYYNLPDIVI